MCANGCKEEFRLMFEDFEAQLLDKLKRNAEAWPATMGFATTSRYLDGRISAKTLANRSVKGSSNPLPFPIIRIGRRPAVRKSDLDAAIEAGKI